MLAGFMAVPLATPALMWMTLAANLPLALMIRQLIVMAVISNWLSHIAIRIWRLAEVGSQDPHTNNVVQH
jgi:hypothetical protein